MEWIDANKEKPDYFEWVFVYAINNDNYPGIFLASYSDNVGWKPAREYGLFTKDQLHCLLGKDDFYDGYVITHWMRIKEPKVC